MRAAQIGGVAFDAERGDGAPALGAVVGADAFWRAERQEQPPGRACHEARIDERIEIERKADCRLLVSIGVDDGVGAAPARLAGDTVAKQRKAQPALVFETMTLRRIERDPHRMAERGGDRLDRNQPHFENVAKVECTQVRERRRERRGSGDKLEVGPRIFGGQRACILGVERGANGI